MRHTEAFWSGVVLFVVGFVLWTVSRGGTVGSFAPEKFGLVVSVMVHIPLAVVAVYYSH